MKIERMIGYMSSDFTPDHILIKMDEETVEEYHNVINPLQEIRLEVLLLDFVAWKMQAEVCEDSGYVYTELTLTLWL